MIERVIKAKKKFALGTASETHVFEKGEVYNMKFGNSVEFDSLLGFGNFIISNKKELDKYLSGTLSPTEVSEVNVETNVQGSTKPTLKPGATVEELNKILDDSDTHHIEVMSNGSIQTEKNREQPKIHTIADVSKIEEKTDEEILAMVAEGRNIDNLELLSNLSPEKKKVIITRAEESDMSEDAKKTIIAALKKRTMSKCPICGKRKKKEEPFCPVCTQLRDKTVGLGVGAV